MAIKFAILFAILAAVNAGYLAGPAYAPAAYSYAAPHAVAAPALVSQHANILRSPGNLGQVSTFSKSINTPYSSVTKHDVRVSNDALAYAHRYAAAPAYAHAYTSPAYTHAYSAPAYTTTYSAPAYTHSYAAPAYAHGYAAPAYASGYAAHAPAGLLGVAYSAAPAAAHFSYSNGYGLHYSY